MGDIIRDWLRTRLGVIIDLSPEIFGRYASDGTLLGKVLHSYDVINDSQLSTLLVTQDPALSRVNLKNLRLWLRFIGVDCDAECIEDISNCKGTASLRLFYKVFLCLENKDRLHFITLQKEREKYLPSSTKFDVTTVAEEPEAIVKPEDHRYAENLRKSVSLVDWQRRKYDRLVDDLEKSRERFRASQRVERQIEESISALATRKTESTTGRRVAALLEEHDNRREVDEFARRHRVRVTQEKADPCDDSARQGSPKRAKSPRVDHEAARAYTRSLKKKHRQEEFTKNFKTRLQKNLLTELWQSVLDDQELEFDELVAKKVLHQSQYEKQLVRKLCDIRSQKSRMAQNREIVEMLVEERREREMRLDEDRLREVMVRESEEVEAENRRINELERRIEEQARERRRNKSRRFAADIVGDIIDIAAKSADYKITSGESRVPESLWREWKALFFKGLPIIEDPSGYTDLQDEEARPEEMITDDDQFRTEILNDEDFDNYHRIQSTWQNFVPHIDEQDRRYLDLGAIVLGHIVNRILCPRDDRESFESPLNRMKTRAVVLDLPGTLLDEPIQELLRKKKIRLIRVEQAIDHCLARYKEEMKDFAYVDLEIVAATREALNPSIVSTELDERGKKVRRKKSLSSAGKVSSIGKIEASKSGIDKVTQTPRVIPHDDMDPLLSDSAYIGKWTHEFLTLGEPISDELCARIILEYLRHLQPKIDGFVLVNYPNTHRQMIALECALSGRKLTVLNSGIHAKPEDTSIEEIDPIAPRIVYENEADSSSLFRQSRLLPNPEKYAESNGEKSYLTAFVRIKSKLDKSESSRRKIYDDDDIWEIMSDDATSIDAFYVDQDLATILYYTEFDLTTLKALAGLIITERRASVSGATSVDLFGDYREYFDERGAEISTKTSRGPVIKRLLRARRISSSYGESQRGESRESREETRIHTERSDERMREILPGDDEWPWANLPQGSRIVESLADLWKNLENSYVENLKDAFNLRRLNRAGILPYKDHVARHAREFVERPDKKQDLLHAFHRAFNEIDREIRDDETIKRELHCRIDDFQRQLWEICDARKSEAENERRRIVSENWTSEATIDLTNVWIDFIQTEIDRCNDTMQFIRDYYTSMVKRPLEDVRTPVILRKIVVDRRGSNGREIPLTGDDSTRSVKKKSSKEIQPRAMKIPQAPLAPDERLFEEEISRILTDVDDEISSSTRCVGHRAIDSNIRYSETLLDVTCTRMIDDLKKEETIEGKASIEKKSSSRKASQSEKIERDIATKRWRDFFIEWHYAIMFEIARLRLRLRIIEAAAMADIDFLIDAMRGVFRDAKSLANKRHERESRSVEEMATSFRFAVEEEIPIQEETLLDGDRFIVRANVLMYPDKTDLDAQSAIREEIFGARFTISQLDRLARILRRSAPSGIFPERSFVYVLQDMIVLGENDENSPLPSAWYDLGVCNVARIVGELFPNEEFVNWREFVVRAINIDYPSVDQLLDTLEAFKRADSQSREIVNCEEFLGVKFWFEQAGTSNETTLVSLDISGNSLGNEEDTDEEIPDKCNWSISVRDDSSVQGDCIKPKEALRLGMAKKLLFEMFATNSQSLNYTALLMAFCKDEEPKMGLAKALSLAVGGKICVDPQEGEEYARRRYEDKRAAKSSGNYPREEATKICQGILHRLLRDIFQSGQSKISDTIEGAESGNGEREDDFQKDFAETSAIGDTPERKNRGVSINLPEEIGPMTVSPPAERAIVYSMHIDVCQSVLAAFLPNYATQPDILETGKSLSENLIDVYQDIREEDDDDAGTILTHRFVDHDFLGKLLGETSAFTTKNLANIMDNIIRDKSHQ